MNWSTIPKDKESPDTTVSKVDQGQVLDWLQKEAHHQVPWRSNVLRNASTTKRKKTRNIPWTTQSNPRNEDRRGTEDKHTNTSQPKKMETV